MKLETTDIVEALVDELAFTFEATNVIDNTDGTYTLETCNTFHIQECFYITNDGNQYLVTKVIKDTSITIQGSFLPVPMFDVYKPYFFHGTVIQTNLELSKQGNVNGRTPFVYLLEILKDRFFEDDSIVERESDLRLFFLTQANFEDWKNADHNEKAILPMRSLAYNFINTLKNNKKIAKFVEYEIINHVKFGVYTTEKGHEKKVFNDNLTGVELRITLPVMQDFECKKCN